MISKIRFIMKIHIKTFAKRLATSPGTNHILLTVVRKALPKLTYFHSPLTNKVRQNSFSFSLSQSSILFAPTKCHSFPGSLPMVIDEWAVSLDESFMYMITCDSNTKDSKLCMCMNHITNGWLHKSHAKQYILFYFKLVKIIKIYDCINNDPENMKSIDSQC